MDKDLPPAFAGSPSVMLQTLEIPSSLRLSVLAPHPDDFDAISISMRFFQRNGNDIHLAVLTSGASGVEDEFGGARTIRAKGRLREKEQLASCRFFGLAKNHVSFLRLAEDEQGHLVEDPENLAKIRRYLQKVNPRLLFLPHGNDTNLDHQRTYASVRRILWEDELQAAVFLNRDPKTIALHPDFYIDFGEADAKWKGELLRFHQSQHQRNLNSRGHGFDERILQLNRQIAKELNCSLPFAELFEREQYGQPIFQIAN
jgi:LmbE family N-acetylglucosaminyl deacetylase